jgi:hypothetical protein
MRLTIPLAQVISSKACLSAGRARYSQIESLIDRDLYYQFKEELEILEDAGADFGLHQGE